MKKNIIGTGIALLACVSLAYAQGYSFGTDLRVGSTGADVSALQSWLIQNGYHIPSIESGAAAKGLFGSQTKAAVMKYQKAVGLPNTGFVGPLTRGKLNGNVALTPTSPAMATAAPASSGCPTGYVCLPDGAVTPAGLPAGITTPGVPGIMSVSQGPLSSATINVGQTNVPIISMRVQAQYSDIDVAGLVVDLGTDTSIYNKIFSKIYVMDGQNVVFSTPLNSSSVVQDSGQYVVGTAGYNIIVPKGTYKDIVIKADLYPSIDSKYVNESPWTVSIDQNSVSGVDGAGINLYGPAANGLIFESLTINPSLVDNAQANLSLDPSSPLKISVPVTDTTNNQYLGLPVMVFDVNAQNDNLHLHEVKVNLGTSGTGSINVAYLYQGSTQILSASVSNGVADFNNITDGTNGASIPVNTTVPFTIKVDVTGVTSSANPFNVTAMSSSTIITAYNSIDSAATASGNAIGNTQTVASIGPLFTLSGTPTITKSNITAGGSSVTTFQYTATFNVNVQAIGTNVELGLPASTTAAFGTSTTSITLAQIYQNGIASSTATSTSPLIAAYSQPTGTTLDGASSFVVSRNQSITIPVSYSFTVTSPNANVYAIQLQGINASTGFINFMANQPAWRTTNI